MSLLFPQDVNFYTNPMAMCFARSTLFHKVRCECKFLYRINYKQKYLCDFQHDNCLSVGCYFQRHQLKRIFNSIIKWKDYVSIIGSNCRKREVVSVVTYFIYFRCFQPHWNCNTHTRIYLYHNQYYHNNVKYVWISGGNMFLFWVTCGCVNTFVLRY